MKEQTYIELTCAGCGLPHQVKTGYYNLKKRNGQKDFYHSKCSQKYNREARHITITPKSAKHFFNK